MTKLRTFEDAVTALARFGGSVGHAFGAFRVVESSSPFVEPLLNEYELDPDAKVTFISARGASGKSTMAEQLSHRLGAPLWSLGEDKAVSGDALAARLSAFLGVVDPLPEVATGRVPLLVIDAMDEARLRVTGVSWDEFMASLVQYAQAGVHLVVLGRKRTIDDVWYSMADSGIAASWYEISHFNKMQQTAYVDLRALGGVNTLSTPAYVDARSAVLAELNGASDSGLNEAFAGYAPVLDAVAALLKPPANYQQILNSFESSSAAGSRLKVLQRILDALLTREQTKVASLADQIGIDPSVVYTADEQLDWLAAELLGAPSPTLDWCPPTKRAEYVESLQTFFLDHPFREADAWASPVFASYCAAVRLDRAARKQLQSVSGLSGLLFEFAIALAGAEALVIDEAQFYAIHNSLMAGQWQSSTSVVSVRPTPEGKDDATVDSVDATLVLLHPDGTTATLTAAVLLDRPGRLHLISPLANIDVDFPGTIVVSSESLSLDLGPEVYLRAASIELAGASLQVSKDTGSADSVGSTVELEVTESFITSAALIGNVSVNDFSIVLPSTHKLAYPWHQYRAEPEDQRDDAGADQRARRLLNKLMSLARRHGHGGERAVFDKKLEGRQGFQSAEFKRAVAALATHGVLRVDGDMLFITEAWDKHRYDGKGRDGMPSYDDKRDVWEPVLRIVTEAVG